MPKLEDTDEMHLTMGGGNSGGTGIAYRGSRSSGSEQSTFHHPNGLSLLS
jgi:hypothetical protein